MGDYFVLTLGETRKRIERFSAINAELAAALGRVPEAFERSVKEELVEVYNNGRVWTAWRTVKD